MNARIAFVHTVGFLADKFRDAIRSELPAVDSFHMLNESLLQDLLRGAEPALVYRRVVAQLLLAVDAGASLIVMTCSSTSPAVDLARQLTNIPVLKIDDPMAAEAVRGKGEATRIGLLCTATSTVAPSTALLRSHAAAQGRDVAIQPVVNSDAYAALMAGDRTLHDRLVRQSASKLAASSDVLVLAQASLAHMCDELAADLSCPVLASPPLLMRELARRLDVAPRQG